MASTTNARLESLDSSVPANMALLPTCTHTKSAHLMCHCQVQGLHVNANAQSRHTRVSNEWNADFTYFSTDKMAT